MIHKTCVAFTEEDFSKLNGHFANGFLLLRYFTGWQIATCVDSLVLNG